MTVRLLQGHVIDRLKELPDESVHCCVTSPPYWGLRSYGCDGQIGLEATIEEYVVVMVEVFREVKRVLRNDGVCWLNLGDSYAGSGGPGSQYDSKAASGFKGEFKKYTNPNKAVAGLKPKDLVGIPWRVALALQADGWYLRMDVIWHKPNPMPESVTDRPTKAHEYIFLLSKSERYFYDAVAIAEDSIHAGRIVEYDGTQKNCIAGDTTNDRRTLIDRTLQVGASRNKRSVWTVPTHSFPGSHFATFPPDLIKPCILAGTSEKGCCPQCGKPWRRVIEKTGHKNQREVAHAPKSGPTKTDSTGWAPTTKATDQWQPSCKCGLEAIPCTVLDPFGGSGTTGMVADRLGRDAILIDLNPDYVAMAKRRIEDDAGMFANVKEEL